MDNASENKCRWILGLCVWFIKRGWIKEAKIDMMLVGHTHKDIAAVFRRIYEMWKKKGGCLNP
eukprot:6209603-Pleurochrysis_carterae.AAC.1